jgi:hypothetical protein
MGIGNPKGTNRGGGPKGQKITTGYEVRPDGTVWRIRKNRCDLMKGWRTHKGYHSYTINGKSVDGHRLVAEKFLPNPLNLPQVDHINRVRHDNRVENLRWVTRTENMQNIVWGGTVEKAIAFLEGHGYTIIPPDND